MLHKTMIGLFAAAAVAMLAPDTASARGGFGGGHGGGFHGGGFRGGGIGMGGGGFRAAALPVAGFRGGSFAVNSFRGGIHPGFRHHHRFPIAAAAIGFGLGYGAYDYGYGYPYYAGYDDGYYYGDGGCYVVQQRVLTSYGWRVRPVQVCN